VISFSIMPKRRTAQKKNPGPAPKRTRRISRVEEATPQSTNINDTRLEEDIPLTCRDILVIVEAVAKSQQESPAPGKQSHTQGSKDTLPG